MDQDSGRRFRLFCGRDFDEPRGGRLPVIRSSIKLALGPAVLAARLFVGATGKFGHGRRYVFKSDQPQRYQALEIVAAILRGPVVESGEARGAQFRVIELE